MLRLAWLGDVVGRAGRMSVAHAVPVLRERGAQVVLANAENVRHGRGLHPVGYEEVCAAGVDAITLGDHTTDDHRLLSILEDPAQPIAKPANLAQWGGAKRWVRVPQAGNSVEAPVFVVSILGRLFMRFEPEPPFDVLDRTIEEIVGKEPGALILLEVHAEATSEKVALMWHCRRRWPETVVAVVGSHTHVQTSDARIVDGRVAAMTDLGMCGARRSIIGFNIQASLERFRGERGTALDVAEEEPVAEGCLIDLDVAGRRAVSIEAFRILIP